MAGQVDLVIADLRRFVRGEMIALGLNVNANLRDTPPLGTPIDTGWASANWVPSVDSPYEAPAEADEPEPAQVAAQAVIAQQGLNAVLSWDFNNGSIFSTNNVPYINRLNQGWSGQTTAGFVPRAVERAVRQTGAGATTRGNRGRRASAFRTGRGR